MAGAYYNGKWRDRLERQFSVTQTQVLSYLQFYANRCDLRRNIQ